MTGISAHLIWIFIFYNIYRVKISALEARVGDRVRGKWSIATSSLRERATVPYKAFVPLYAY